MKQICPNPRRWHEIYERLRTVCQQRSLSLPPVPLILNGWVYSNDTEKAERWNATAKWATDNGLPDLVVLNPSDWYSVNTPSTCEIGPFGGPMYLPWRFTPSARPSFERVQSAMDALNTNWTVIAGEFASYTTPLRFTGTKMRRLLVSVAGTAPLPPWGDDWNCLASDHRRRAFTVFRQNVNEIIAPMQVDHIDFEMPGSGGTAKHLKRVS
jgi:hypothetical protein